MVSRTERKFITTRLVVLVVLVAFCVVLLGETANATLYPWGNKPRSVSTVRAETDDDPFSIDRAPAVNPPLMHNSNDSIKAKPTTFSFATLLSLIWNLNFDIVQPPVEPQTKESAQW